MKIKYRIIHRNLAYFYVGLIISFAFSGILNNHRNDWDIEQNYTYQTEDFEVPIPVSKREYSNREKVTLLAEKWHPDSKYLGYRVRNNQLRAFYQDNTIIDLDLETGMGTIEFRRKKPIIGHTMFLHKFSNNYWKIYSDIFAISLIIIAVTGMSIPMGKNGFKKRGWKLMLLGLIIPIVFLFLFA
jgi:hypothetical protein